MSLIRRSSAAPLPVTPEASIPAILKSCKTLKTLHQIHARIIGKGLEQDHLIVTRFLCVCNSLSSVRYATEVFDRVAVPNLYLWNTLVKAHSDHSSLSQALSFFNLMRQRSVVRPDGFTFPPLLKSCSNAAALREGASIHCAVVRCGVESDVFVRTALIDLYGKCREVELAQKLFSTMEHRNVVSWTAMIVGYLSNGDLGCARVLFDKMPKRNVATWNAMIDGYVKSGDLGSARRLFEAMPERNAVSFTSLMDGFTKAGDMASARFLFDQSEDRDIFSWSAMISGYSQNGRPIDALKIFFEMLDRNIKPDEFIMVGLMSACSQLGGIQLARWVDSYMTQSEIDLKRDHVVAALIDMNAKCGNMERAAILFEALPKRDLISYCSMMQGYSIHGFGTKAVELFSQLLHEGLTPDDVGFTVVLTACSHAGLVEEGYKYFKMMKDEYHIVPSSDHYACIVDLLGRAGRLAEAYGLIKLMPMKPHAGAWGALLGACKLHCDIDLGEIVAGRLFKIEPQNAGNYVLLSNIYAAANRWADVSKLRTMMRERGIRKIPGCSWI